MKERSDVSEPQEMTLLDMVDGYYFVGDRAEELALLDQPYSKILKYIRTGMEAEKLMIQMYECDEHGYIGIVDEVPTPCALCIIERGKD